MSPKIYSFDVFDTVLTRTFAYPVDLFFELADRLRTEQQAGLGRDGALSSFPGERVAAERIAREESGLEDVDLESIYKVLARRLGWSEGERKRFLELELELMRQSLRRVPGMAEEVRQRREAGAGILFISDMYLPAPTLRHMLEQAGVFVDGDRVYVSCDAGVTKRSGRLFEHILSRETFRPADWHHTGDQWVADVEAPSRFGISARHFTDTHLNVYERLIAAASESIDRCAGSKLAAACRWARLSCPYSDTHRATIWRTGCDVAGPTIIGFVSWVLEQAVARQMKRLYFEARDGQILCEVARQLAWDRGLDVECGYLYGSRYAWFLASFTDIGDKEIQWLIPDIPQVRLATVWARAGLQAEEAESLLGEAGWPEAALERQLDRGERRQLASLLRVDPIRSRILEAAAKRRAAVRDYFEQEGLFDDVPYALVDTGWSGRTQEVLERLFGLLGRERALDGLYFSLGYRETRCAGTLQAYFCDYQFPSLREETAKKVNALLEVFLAADHGCVMNYRSDETGRQLPVFSEAVGQMLTDWGVGVQQEAIRTLVKTLLEFGSWRSRMDGWMIPATERVLHRFYDHPSPDEAGVYGSAFFSEDHATDSTGYVLAQPYAFHEVLRYATGGRARPERPLYADWRPASLRLSSMPIRWAMRGVERFREKWVVD